MLDIYTSSKYCNWFFFFSLQYTSLTPRHLLKTLNDIVMKSWNNSLERKLSYNIILQIPLTQLLHLLDYKRKISNHKCRSMCVSVNYLIAVTFIIIIIIHLDSEQYIEHKQRKRLYKKETIWCKMSWQTIAQIQKFFFS